MDIYSSKWIHMDILDILYMDIYICIYWMNYNHLTATSLESWLIREIIPKWP